MDSMASQCLFANPLIVLREEFDDWAILFDPDTGNAFGLNPVGVFIWKLLDGNHSPEDIVKGLRENAEEVPGEADEHLDEFLQDLVKKGLAGYEVQN
jgi:SynChlorMet cassette protein ScmD